MMLRPCSPHVHYHAARWSLLKHQLLQCAAHCTWSCEVCACLCSSRAESLALELASVRCSHGCSRPASAHVTPRCYEEASALFCRGKNHTAWTNFCELLQTHATCSAEYALQGLWLPSSAGADHSQVRGLTLATSQDMTSIRTLIT